MPISGRLSAALAYTPNWWREITDPAAFEALLLGWAETCNWRSCGFVWPGESSPPVVLTVERGAMVPAPAPLEVPDALRRIKAGEPHPTYSAPGGATRAFASIQPSGRGVA